MSINIGTYMYFYFVLLYCYTIFHLILSVPEFKCLDKKEILKIADVLQEVSLYSMYKLDMVFGAIFI